MWAGVLVPYHATSTGKKTLSSRCQSHWSTHTRSPSTPAQCHNDGLIWLIWQDIYISTIMLRHFIPADMTTAILCQSSTTPTLMIEWSNFLRLLDIKQMSHAANHLMTAIYKSEASLHLSTLWPFSSVCGSVNTDQSHGKLQALAITTLISE